MFKEKYENAKNFVKEHKTEIIIGVVGVSTIAFLGYKCSNYKKANLQLSQTNNDMGKELTSLKRRVDWYGTTITNLEIGMEHMYDMFIRHLTDEESRIVFEMQTLNAYIENLDKTSNINKFVNIPDAEKRLNELAIKLKTIMIDKEKAEEIVKYILH